MRLKLTLHRPGDTFDDVVVTVDPGATVGHLAREVQRVDPRAVQVGRGGGAGGDLTLAVLTRGTGEAGAQWSLLPMEMTVAESGVCSGAAITVTPGSSRYDDGAAGPVAATLHVLEGPERGRELPLHRGTNVLGRDYDCDVRLRDPLVSKRHAKIDVTDVVEVVDQNSANGVQVGGGNVTRYVLAADTVVAVGDTRFVVTRTGGTGGTAGGAGGGVGGGGLTTPHNRAPRLDPQYEGIVEEAPAPPDPPKPQHFPIVSMLVPVAMGGVLYMITKSVASLAFLALAPLMLVGTAGENRMFAARGYRKATAAFREALRAMSDRIAAGVEVERATRRREHPATEDVVRALHQRGTLLWARRPEHASFLQLRLGLGNRPSRSSITLPHQGKESPELYRELVAVQERFRTVDGVPVVADLRDTGAVGVAGPAARRMDVMRALVVQLAGLHSPQEVQLALVCPPSSVALWHWLSWLPHAMPERSPLGVGHLASAPDACARLVAAVEGLIEIRGDAGRRSGPGSVEDTLPAVVLIVEEGAPVERGRLVEIAENGADAGVYVLWTASTPESLPAACRTFVSLDPNSAAARAGFVRTAESVDPLEPEVLSAERTAAAARSLAPVIDAGAALDDESDLPASVSFLELAGRSLADSTEAVADQWRLSNSLPTTTLDGKPSVRQKRDNTLRALVGEAGGAPLHLDLREQGPHALVGGTTGAGKSELLQAWILGMATAHSPSRVNFLFVDYKGGAAFSKCVELPHTVGLVTDLSPRLVQRVLTSLKAELRYREHLLNRKKAKDLISLERAGDPEAPPSLVIVVDEFAALAKEVPEFVDGVVDVAQRGRSLGLHLILATQRPAGVIKDNLRANTNLRIALRMADEADSTDVIGGPQAAAFDPGLPGRAVAKTGPGRTVPFQTAYAGGWTSTDAPPPPIFVEELGLAGNERWEAAEDPSSSNEPAKPLGPNDLERIVGTVRETATLYGFGVARRPWLDELSPVYDLARLPSSRSDAELVFGVLDDPDGQVQPTVAFAPDSDGSMAVYGTSGAGKSAFLRTLAVAAADTSAPGPRNGPCQVYGLDFAARGLDMLQDLPHVGSIVSGDDQERVQRLVNTLRELIDERAVRYARAAAGTIADYRAITGRPDEPRVLLLVDGMGAFRQAYEVGPHGRLFETFMSLALDGRPVGVHVVVTAERTGAIPTSLSASLQRRLVLRLSSETDLSTLGAPLDGFDADSPPGRGYLDGMEVQVAVFGGSANVAEQAAMIRRLAERMQQAGRPEAPPVGRLAERVSLSDLGPLPGGAPVLGIAEDSLQAIAFTTGDVLLVAGPPQSGKTTTLATIVTSLVRSSPDLLLYYLGNRRSLLPRSLPWTRAVTSPEEVAELAQEITRVLEKDPPAPGTLAVVIEGVGDFLNSAADLSLQDLVKACRNCEQTVIAEGETSGLAGSWPLLQVVKSGRHGLVLQPDQGDGDLLFRTPFPRSNRSDFPPGRANYVRSGRVTRVQVALPE